jgi:hypothetical protein
MKISARILASFAFVGLFVCAGCGLVPIPVSRTLPNPIRQIEIVREDTSQTISNAEVVIYADRFKNWTRSFPPYYTVAYMPPTKNSLIIPLKEESSGVFTNGKLQVWRFIRPWGVGPLGTTMYEDYKLTVSVRADGFNSVTATYFPAGGFHPQFVPQTNFSFPRLGTNGSLTIYLRRSDAE